MDLMLVIFMWMGGLKYYLKKCIVFCTFLCQIHKQDYYL